MRRHFWAGLLGLAAFVPGQSFAGEPPTGHWKGSYICQNVWQTANVDIWPDASEPNGLRGRFSFSSYNGGNTPSGSYYVSLERTDGGGWMLVPEQWESQPDGYVMVAISLTYTTDQLSGLIEDQICMGKARSIHLSYTGESMLEASTAPSGSAGTDSTVNAPAPYVEPDYMRRAAEERKAQNQANCERAAKGANVYCDPHPY